MVIASRRQNACVRVAPKKNAADPRRSAAIVNFLAGRFQARPVRPPRYGVGEGEGDGDASLVVLFLLVVLEVVFLASDFFALAAVVLVLALVVCALVDEVVVVLSVLVQETINATPRAAVIEARMDFFMGW